MFYVIETKYVGPNPDQHVDDDTIEIRTVPARTNSSRETRIHGWCGTTNDRSIHAHGEYETLDEARSAIKDIFGEVRDSDQSGHTFECDDENTLETFKEGMFTPMSCEETADWAYSAIKCDINADTTDDEISILVDEYEKDANDLGFTLLGDLDEMMKKWRQDLIDEINGI